MMGTTEGVAHFMNGWALRPLSLSRRFARAARSLSRTCWLTALFLGLGAVTMLRAGEAFEQANKFYEEGRFNEAAAAYQTIVDNEGGSSTLYFNMGNAYFKADQIGRAIAAYQLAERLDPRDPSVRFNLQFTRQQVTGKDFPSGSVWRRALTGLTLNEWTTLFSLVYWIWILLLCAREARPGWRRTLSGYTATTGLLVFLLGGCLAGAWYQWNGIRSAVVIAQETLVRHGPLEESQVSFQLRDGSEVTVLDRKQSDQPWLQIRDSASREGWLKAKDVIVIGPPTANK